MEVLYPFFIAFIIIVLAELGDKTQLLVLSFASKSKVRNVLLGVAIGTFFSHGIAIIFGSRIGILANESLLTTLKFITYIIFLVIGIIGFIPKKSNSAGKENSFITKMGHSSLNYIFVVAMCIFAGEIGDKTFLSSLGLGLEYPNYKIALIAGSILGMIVSNSIAILFGRFIESRVPAKYIQTVSNMIFIVFGIIGILMILGTEEKIIV